MCVCVCVCVCVRVCVCLCVCPVFQLPFDDGLPQERSRFVRDITDNPHNLSDSSRGKTAAPVAPLQKYRIHSIESTQLICKNSVILGACRCNSYSMLTPTLKYNCPEQLVCSYFYTMPTETTFMHQIARGWKSNCDLPPTYSGTSWEDL